MSSSAQPVEEASVGELTARLSHDLSTLIRDELRLAQVETSDKAKKVGLGVGLFGVSALIAYLGAATFVAAAILGLANAVDPWIAAVIVGAALLLIAAIAALAGKQGVSAGTPPVPTEAMAGIKADVNTLREGARR